MYIALKWLISLASIMWVAMCCMDLYFKMLDTRRTRDLIFIHDKNGSNFKVPLTQKTFKVIEQQNSHSLFYHYIMFFAGAVIVSLYNRKQHILLIIKKYCEINKGSFENYRQKYFSIETINYFGAAIVKYVIFMWIIIRISLFKYFNNFIQYRCNKKFENPNAILLKRFIDLKEERKNLGKLLLATIRENKNIRMRFQLENLAKNRLARYIEETQKIIKENRCRYVNFQQLYLATHQENVFLKTRIKKLINEKDNSERNLIALINEICRSTNKDLKSYCSKLIVETRNNLLNLDVKNEIRKFLDKSNNKSSNSILKNNTSDNDTKIVEIIENECINMPDAPKLRGLPGEYVWTIRDKNGLIKRLYEYNVSSDYDNGDIIRRIRQYTVYCDKDCLLDCSSSSSCMNISSNSSMTSSIKRINYPITSQRFLTGSEAFQTFLKHNENIVQCPARRSVKPC